MTISLPRRSRCAVTAGALFAAALALASAARGAQWEPLGPDGGPLSAFAEAPNGRTLYAGSLSAGVFRSANGGRSWRRLPAPLPSVSALAVDAASSATVYAGTAAGLYQSRDGGASWRLVDLRLPDFPSTRAVTALLTDPRRAGSCWAAFDDRRRLFRTLDGGATWELRVNGLDRVVYSLAMHPRNAGRLYAGTDQGVFVSRDSGAHWSRLGLRGKLTVNLSVDAGSAETVHAVTVEPVNHYGITADHLYVFAPATHGIFRPDDGSSVPGSDLYYPRVASDPFTPGRCYAATAVGIFLQTRAGAPWEILARLPADTIAPSRVDPHTLFASSLLSRSSKDTSLVRSRDGGDSWEPADRGLSTTPMTQIAIDPADSNRLFARLSYGELLLRSLDGGASWERIGGELLREVSQQLLTDPAHAGTVYLLNALRVWKSVDGGDSWQAIGVTYDALALDPGEPGILYGGSGVFPRTERSRDGGATWEDLPGAAGLTTSVLAVPQTGGAAPRPVYANGFAVAPSNGHLYRDRLRRSTDGGDSWTTLLVPELSDTIFTDIEAAGAAGTTRIYAAFYEADQNFHPVHGGIFRSSDDGATWESLSVRPDRPPINTLALDPRDGAHLFAGTPQVGVFESRDGGTTWASIAGDLPHADVTSLELDPNDPHRLFASLLGAGAFRLAL